MYTLSRTGALCHRHGVAALLTEAMERSGLVQPMYGARFVGADFEARTATLEVVAAEEPTEEASSSGAGAGGEQPSQQQQQQQQQQQRQARTTERVLVRASVGVSQQGSEGGTPPRQAATDSQSVSHAHPSVP